MKMELRMKGKKPKFPLLGSHAEVKNIFPTGKLSNRSDDFTLRQIHITIGVRITSDKVTIISMVL
ncbi:hypothetical protein ES708_26721 [subsurface metagenome]